jgi:glycosyltransferase involved in cell wall biosynthesis
MFSLAKQSFTDYEVIIVDQNGDDRVMNILAEFTGVVSYIRLCCSPGACKARNLGFSTAKGEIVAFPDDDCWYTPSLLANVDQWFREQNRYSIFAVGAEDEAGVRSGNRWIQSSCDLHPINVFRTTFCSSLFIRNTEQTHEAFFDETIGPGGTSSFGCGDETDFVLQLMGMGQRGRFDRTWHICHARRDMLSSSISQKRATSYGGGMGYVLRKHSLNLLCLLLVSYDYLRGVAIAMRGRMEAARLCFAHGQGILVGFSAGEPQFLQQKGEVKL